jgi:hypothetical protein
MSRPKPTVLLEFVDTKNNKVEQILEAEAIWAVFYRGAPFNLKSADVFASANSPKYKKVSFSNPGHAHNLAEKLNRMFKCNDFSVVKLTKGERDISV